MKYLFVHQNFPGQYLHLARHLVTSKQHDLVFITEPNANQIGGEGQTAAVVLADVASPDACASVVAESAAALGGIDGLVLNVGIGLGRGMTGTSAAQWDEVFAANVLKSAVAVTYGKSPSGKVTVFCEKLTVAAGNVLGNKTRVVASRKRWTVENRKRASRSV